MPEIAKATLAANHHTEPKKQQAKTNSKSGKIAPSLIPTTMSTAGQEQSQSQVDALHKLMIKEQLQGAHRKKYQQSELMVVNKEMI